jgi:hypothetical protein
MEHSDLQRRRSHAAMPQRRCLTGDRAAVSRDQF